MNNETRQIRFSGTTWIAVAVAAVLVLSFGGTARAWPPGGNGGGKGGGGGGSTGGSAYAIIDLPGPQSTQSAAQKISNVNAFGTTFVLGYYGTISQPCVWTIGADGTVAATGLDGLIDDGNDINSDGIIVGRTNNSP